MLIDLIDGRSTRERASQWAIPWVLSSAPLAPADEAVWDLVEKLAMADMPSTDRPYLFEASDFQQWLKEFDSWEDAPSEGA